MNTSPNKIHSAIEELMRTDRNTNRTLFAKTTPLLSNKAFVVAILRTERDEASFRRDITDPKGYFEDEGCTLPPGTKVAAMEGVQKVRLKSRYQNSVSRLFGLWKYALGERGKLRARSKHSPLSIQVNGTAHKRAVP